MSSSAETDFTDPTLLTRCAEASLQIARDIAPSAEVEVALASGSGLSVTVRGGACELLESEHDKSLAVTIYLDGRKGSATTSDFSADALRATVGAAHAIAEQGEADRFAGLAAATDLAADVPDLDLDHPWDIEGEAAIALALACENAALSADARIKQSDGVSVNRYRGARAYANSHGFSGAYRATRHSLSAVMIGAEDAGMQRGYWYTSARSPTQLTAPEEVGRLATARTIAKLGARRIPTTEMPVIFEPRVAGGLVGHLISAISGSAQYRRASFLLDALGEQVLPEHLELHEAPHLPGAIGSAPFDADGIATREKAIVAAGRLETYLLSAYAARRLNRAPTGNAGGTHNLILTPGTRTLEEIIAATDRALLVTDLMGFGVNGVTGDYSRGAAGFLISRGERAHAVEEITIAGNLRDMLMNITEVGIDVDESLAVRTGSLCIGRMAIAGS